MTAADTATDISWAVPSNAGSRTQLAIAVLTAVVALFGLLSCSTTSLADERISVAAAGLKAGEMPALDPASIKLAEQRGSRDPEYAIVAEIDESVLEGFLSTARLNRATEQAVVTAAKDTLSGTLPIANIDTFLHRANLRSYDAHDFTVINERVGSTYRIFNYACKNSRCGAVIIVSTT